MNLKLIACNVFMREACHCLARSPHIIDPEFTELGEHVHSATLRASLQQRIDAADSAPRHYDAILLLFGLCGNATVGLRAGGTPLVIPRAHDCCTILLGSTARFQEHFGENPSTPFSSVGYLERGEYFLRTADDDCDRGLAFGDAFAAYVEQYGEENARCIWDAMHPPPPAGASRQAVFIELPETKSLGHAEKFAAKAAAEGLECVKLEGNIGLIDRLLGGTWDPSEMLLVAPGQEIAGKYDWSEVLGVKSQ